MHAQGLSVFSACYPCIGLIPPPDARLWIVMRRDQLAQKRAGLRKGLIAIRDRGEAIRWARPAKARKSPALMNA
jgi:hypothetical protein